MEKEIIKTIHDSMMSALENSLKDSWRSGIDEIVKAVVQANREKIEQKYNKVLNTVLNSKGFETAITDEFKHKVAKNMVAKLEGQVEQAVNIIRQDQKLRAKMVVAIEKIIEENQ